MLENAEGSSLDGENNETLEVENGTSPFVANLFWFLDLIGLFVVSVVLVQTFFYRSMHVEGKSMQNTFQPKDSLGVSDLFYEPKQFDVVIINTKELLGRTIIKRIIGLPGDTIRIENGDVFVNDVKLNEPYLKPGIKTFRNGFSEGIVPVPEGYFFALGDNRPGSSDSRNYGFFKLSKIVGKVCFRWWPLSKMRFF